MKFLIAILAVVALAHAEGEFKVKNVADIFAIQEECVKEASLNEEQTQKVKNFEFSDEEKIRKYLLCSVIKLGVFTEEKGYIPENVTKQFQANLDEAEVLAIVNGCIDKNEQGSSADVWAYRGNRCLENSKIGETVKDYLRKELKEAKQ